MVKLNFCFPFLVSVCVRDTVVDIVVDIVMNLTEDDGKVLSPSRLTLISATLFQVKTIWNPWIRFSRRKDFKSSI
jgi:hypothetical protein